MYKKIVKLAVGSIIMFNVLTGCGVSTYEENEIVEIESNTNESNIAQNTLLSIKNGEDLVIGDEYLIRDVDRNSAYIIFLYCEKDDERFIIRLKGDNNIFESGYSFTTLSAIYPGDYIKYIGNETFEWVPNYGND